MLSKAKGVGGRATEAPTDERDGGVEANGEGTMVEGDLRISEAWK